MIFILQQFHSYVKFFWSYVKFFYSEVHSYVKFFVKKMSTNFYKVRTTEQIEKFDIFFTLKRIVM